MKYIKQEPTVFDAHGHWNTMHTVGTSLNEALALMDLICKAYPSAFTHNRGDKWIFGKVDYNKIPDINIQSIAKVLEQILDKEP